MLAAECWVEEDWTRWIWRKKIIFLIKNYGEEREKINKVWFN